MAVTLDNEHLLGQPPEVAEVVQLWQNLPDINEYIPGLKARIKPEALPILLILFQLRTFLVPAQASLNALGLALNNLIEIHEELLFFSSMLIFISTMIVGTVLQKAALEKRGFTANYFSSGLYVLFPNSSIIAAISSGYSLMYRGFNPNDIAAASALLLGGTFGKEFFSINMISWTIMYTIMGILPTLAIYQKKDTEFVVAMKTMVEKIQETNALLTKPSLPSVPGFGQMVMHKT